jgi:hypothetical protein
MRVFLGCWLAVVAATLLFRRGSLPELFLFKLLAFERIIVFSFAAVPFVIARKIAARRQVRSVFFDRIRSGASAMLFSRLPEYLLVGILMLKIPLSNNFQHW